MENRFKKRDVQRARRVLRVRSKVQGTAQKPRMCVCKSNKHISVQLIDDENSLTLASAGTMTNEMKKTELNKKSKGSAKAVGEKIAQLAKQKSISTVVFDRGRNKFHGIIAELANAARESGLQF